jgi:hypothetical protein
VAVTLLLHVLVCPLMVPAVRAMDRPGARPGAKGGACAFALQSAISLRLFHLRRPELRGVRGGGSDGGGSSDHASGGRECGVLASPAEDDSGATARQSVGDASLEREHEDSGDIIEVIESPPRFKAEHFEVEGADGERVFDFTKMHEQHPQARFPT